MKKQYAFLGIFFLALSFAFAQTSIKVQIDHKLASADFAFNQASSNNMGHNFKLTRCEYYLSGFEIVHDGGTVTAVEDLYALVQADESTTIDLGEYNINMVEAIRFRTGVDASKNHADPGAYPVTHPLGPKNPSMHWGWAAGYRFLAVEGKSGTNLNFDTQIHALGDKHYYIVELPMGIASVNNVIVLPVSADMAKVFESININAGLIEHSEDNQAATAMQNMRDLVFSTASTTGADEAKAVQSFEVFPNPNNTGLATISLDLEAADADFQVRVSDVLGKQVFLSAAQKSRVQLPIELPTSGIYVVSVLKNGKAVLNKKLVVNK